MRWLDCEKMGTENDFDANNPFKGEDCGITNPGEKCPKCGLTGKIANYIDFITPYSGGKSPLSQAKFCHRGAFRRWWFLFWHPTSKCPSKPHLHHKCKFCGCILAVRPASDINDLVDIIEK